MGKSEQQQRRNPPLIHHVADGETIAASRQLFPWQGAEKPKAGDRASSGKCTGRAGVASKGRSEAIKFPQKGVNGSPLVSIHINRCTSRHGAAGMGYDNFFRNLLGEILRDSSGVFSRRIRRSIAARSSFFLSLKPPHFIGVKPKRSRESAPDRAGRRFRGGAASEPSTRKQQLENVPTFPSHSLSHANAGSSSGNTRMFNP
jgi:hypothetical protein